MSWTTVGITFHCDACGAESEIVPAPMQSYFDEHVPDGWTSFRGATMHLDLKDFYGAPVNHLCPSCSALDIAGIIAKLTEHVERERERARA